VAGLTKVLTPSEIARATADMVLALQKKFPQAQIVPCDTIEGEALHLEVQLPHISEEERKRAQEEALDLKRQIEDRYGLSILVRVVSQT